LTNLFDNHIITYLCSIVDEEADSALLEIVTLVEGGRDLDELYLLRDLRVNSAGRVSG
jgi:hypothetical protein